MFAVSMVCLCRFDKIAKKLDLAMASSPARCFRNRSSGGERTYKSGAISNGGTDNLPKVR